jgi:hypothetical protein
VHRGEGGTHAATDASWPTDSQAPGS